MNNSTPLLSVEHLRVENRTGDTVVDDVTFDVRKGAMTALVGESGSGKTMVARSILRLLPPGIFMAAGRIRLDGEDLSEATAARMRELRGGNVGMVFQDPMSSLNPALTVGAQMAEALELHATLDRAQVREQCLDMLQRVRIPDPARCLAAYPHEFSGGMRQRIILASVMLPRPRLLIADEPTTALDTLVEREILELVERLADEFETAVLLITHDLGLVARHTLHTVVLRGGRLVEQGPSSRIMTAPETSYARELLDAVPRRGTAAPEGRTDRPLIAVRNLSVRYARPRSLFRRPELLEAVTDTSLEVHEGEFVAVVGGSGSGKTTLGRAILGVQPYTDGEIRFRGKNIATLDRDAYRDYRLSCQLIFQDPFSSLDPRIRILDTVAEPLRHEPGKTSSARRRCALDTLQEVGLEGMEARLPHQLSGGQRQRVAIARAIVRRPQFVVADEPVSALDMTIQKQILALLMSLQKRHRFACLFISHDLAAVGQIADRIIVMHRGRIVEAGGRDEIFDAPRHGYTRALVAASANLALTDHGWRVRP